MVRCCPAASPVLNGMCCKRIKLSLYRRKVVEIAQRDVLRDMKTKVRDEIDIKKIIRTRPSERFYGVLAANGSDSSYVKKVHCIVVSECPIHLRIDCYSPETDQ